MDARIISPGKEFRRRIGNRAAACLEAAFAPIRLCPSAYEGSRPAVIEVFGPFHYNRHTQER
jgi:hypothetical protein